MICDAQRGQALAESLVAALFLSPLFLCTAYLVDFHRATHASALVAREVAVAMIQSPDGIVDKTDLQRIRDVVMSASEIPGNVLPVDVERIPGGDVAEGVESLAFTALWPAIASGSGAFDVPRWRGQRASTGVSMGSTTALGVELDLPVEVREQLAFFSGHGAAESATQVRDRTAALSVAGTLAMAVQPIEAVAAVASVLEPSLRQLCIGRIDPDIVPADRLPAAVSRTNDLRYTPC